MQTHQPGVDLREEMEELSKTRSGDSNEPLEIDIAGDGDSLFYGDFPSLPDFTCISSSSSSSSTALPTRSSSSSSASSAWAVAKAENEEVGDLMEKYRPGGAVAPPDGMHVPPPDGMDVLDEIADMGIFDDADIWDPTTLFPEDEESGYVQQMEEGDPRGYAHQQQQEEVLVQEGGEQRPSEDLAMVFFEWLKTNKESISPEDLRSIKLKRSTIECAARRLGGGKEGMKQLLKLILAWVQNHHLQKRRNREESASAFQYTNQNQSLAFPVQLPVSGGNPAMDSCFSPSWVNHSSYVTDPATTPCYHIGYPAPPAPIGGFSQPSEFHMTDPGPGWPSQFSQYGGFAADPAPTPSAYIGFANNYHMLHGERFVKMGSSATKEARKKRMARQRRLFTHHHHHRHQNQHASRLSGDATCTNAAQTAQGNWVLCPNSSSAPGLNPPIVATDGGAASRADAAVMQQRQVSSDRRQAWKTEKNLRFLLQKVLKQSDVGNLGRIVLPKKEAETHLPELDARDGISIQMEDIGTSRVWNMRYRYWPNNKSRMYLLENTGDFVRSNGLQEGDFIVIYSDAKCSKYMIRGVKVRKPEVKAEGKAPQKALKSPHANSGGEGSAFSPSSQQSAG